MPAGAGAGAGAGAVVTSLHSRSRHAVPVGVRHFVPPDWIRHARRPSVRHGADKGRLARSLRIDHEQGARS